MLRAQFNGLASAAERANFRAIGQMLRGLVADTVVAGTAAAGAVTSAGLQGKITTESLTTAQNAIYTLTLTNSEIAAGDIVLAAVANGTNSQATPMIGRIQPAAGSVVIQVINKHDSAVAFNGTLVVSYKVHKAA